MTRFLLEPGTLVVLEGLDKTGKTTQRSALAELMWDNPQPLVVHMPSGVAEISRKVYRLLEDDDIESPLARQLLHLACHAETLPHLRSALDERGVILDRCWWSTIAYGLHGTPRVEMNDGPFIDTIKAVRDGLEADLLFLFRAPHESDPHNASSIVEAYLELAARDHERVVEVPVGDPVATTQFLLSELVARSFVVQVP